MFIGNEEAKIAANEYIGAAQNFLVVARKAVVDEDDNECWRNVVAAQDALCEVLDVIKKAYALELEICQCYRPCVPPPPIASVEVVEAEEPTETEE